jgi:hypothetical protein
LYPELLSLSAQQHRRALYVRRRPYTDVVAIALRHADLTTEQLCALNEFRLDQFQLCGFYDQEYVNAHAIREDPDLYVLPPDTIHLMVGASDGRLLAYSYIQPAKGVTRTDPPITMADPVRPWFPCEIESFGPHIFSSLPGLREVVVSRLAEVSILLKNQVAQGPATGYAVVEDVLALALLQISPQVDLAATLAYCDFEARKVIYDLGMTAIYAPYAPILYNNLQPHWTSGANDPYRFWPSVFSSDDFCREISHLQALDALLNLTPREVRAELVSWRRQGRRIEPHALLPAAGTSDVVWITTPDIGPAHANEGAN